MSPVSTTGPIKQALVQKMRADSAIKAAAKGGFHEGLNASDKITYPYVVYQLVFAPLDREWGSVTMVSGFDVVVFSPDPVEADSLDALLIAALDNQPLSTSGLTTFAVTREEELALPPELDDEGRKVYVRGGHYTVWTDQKL